MNTSKLSIERQLQYDEGLKLVLYRDTENKWTIGIGHLISNDPSISKAKAVSILEQKLQIALTPEGRITHAEASWLFQRDLLRVKQGIAQASFCAVYEGLDDVRKSAIQNMVFQLGVHGVSQFKKMWNFINTGNFEAAAMEGLNSKWNKQTPNRAKRVTETLRTGRTDQYNK
ncbi:TPA: glycoside hydrolase family protein [Aeromonas hydrophila]|uniref:Lysozyme n=1 Tax=Aeromonas hydrophila TaxID=644 RepID=A0AAD3UBV4_AERHY|nr:glycoside hydrolase family protein [Aeromonas hydrophila]